jgi:hypothetical protein
MFSLIKESLFRLRWMVMSPRARYAYLWQRSNLLDRIYRQ